ITTRRTAGQHVVRLVPVHVPEVPVGYPGRELGGPAGRLGDRTRPAQRRWRRAREVRWKRVGRQDRIAAAREDGAHAEPDGRGPDRQPAIRDGTVDRGDLLPRRHPDRVGRRSAGGGNAHRSVLWGRWGSDRSPRRLDDDTRDRVLRLRCRDEAVLLLLADSLLAPRADTCPTQSSAAGA